jgi:arginase
VSDVLLLPYHQDERLDDRSITLPAGVEPLVVDPPLPSAGQWQRLVALYDAYADGVAEKVDAGPVRTVTGDCLAAVGTLVGLQRGGLDPSIVWFDAHGDVHTVESSESGYLGGLALRMALGGDFTLLGEPLGLHALAEERAVLVDARDLDPPEERYLASSRVTRTTVDEVSPAVLPDGPLLLHVDVDVIDPRELPGLRFPAADGPTRSRVLAAVERLLRSGRVAAFDVACPWLDTDDEGDVRRRAEVVAAFLALDGATTRDY